MKKKLSLREIQNAEFDMLCDFQEFCDEYGFNPILAYGTLLGAIRHKGFIPWDDDVDVYMERTEYDRFVQIYNKVKKNKNYKLVSCVEGSSMFLFSKIIDLRTSINRPSAFIVEPNKIWIDVFPLDVVPDNRIRRKVYFLKAAMYLSWFGLANTNPNTSSRAGIKGSINRLGGFIFKRIIGTERICRMSIESAKKYRSSSNKDCVCFTWNFDGDRESFPIVGLKNPCDVEFQGKKFKAMSGWEDYLSRLYGSDYMKLPIESKRICHEMEAWIEV